MQQFEDFLATVTFPPNPFRNFDNTLPTSLPLPGHYTTGRFAAAGSPLPNGNAQAGLTAYRSTTLRLDMGVFSCVTCHTLPTGAGPDLRLSGASYTQIPPGPNGERHLALVSNDGLSNVSMKIPQLRNLYEKTGYNATQTPHTAGFGVLHDGSVDSIERFVSEPVFNVTSDQRIADLTAFMLAFSGSDLPSGSLTNILEPLGPPSRDSHAAVGVQTTAGATVDTTLINSMVTQANTDKVSVVAKGIVAGRQRGFTYAGSGNWQSDRVGETYTTAALTALAAPGSEITFTVVPAGSQNRIGIDRDESYGFVRDFVGAVADAGCEVFIVHARNAWLQGLSPKENREVPPLRYEVVGRLAADFPALRFVVNGGVVDDAQLDAHLRRFDGVMVGREAYRRPWWLAEWDVRHLGAAASPVSDRDEVERRMVAYMTRQAAQGVPWPHVARHMLGLMNGRPGARRWRQVWSDHRLRDESPEAVWRRARLAPRPAEALA